MRALTFRCSTGRSPLTRGSPLNEPLTTYTLRSIPAHAGEPSAPSPPRPTGRVDPRSRGGADGSAQLRSIEAGRSPLTRGSPCVTSSMTSTVWSIPAHAGEPRSGSSPVFWPWVDPRSRGGAARVGHVHRPHWGRSPLTRGSRQRRLWQRLGGRSIPAHAGEPLDSLSPWDV